QVVLFPNRFKEDAPEKDRPDYWGAYNPGDGSTIVRVSAWMTKDRYKNAMLRGATSYPIPGKSEADMQQDGVSLEATFDGLASAPHEAPVARGRRSRTRTDDSG